MGIQQRVIISISQDPFWNLAAEEHLLESLTENTRTLLLYTNSAAVIIGKHQNPWLEVNLQKLGEREGVLLRRISGGGAVYHDTGNLNFSFLESRDDFDRRVNLEFVANVLASAGIKTRITDTHDLYADEKKISGNAFCFRRKHVVHHGTLLVDSDLSRLKGLLTPPDIGIETHAVRSKPAATVNISNLYGDVTKEELVTRMTEAFLDGAGGAEHISPAGFNTREVAELAERNRTWEWNYGRTPDFKLNIAGFSISIRKGRVTAVEGLADEEARHLAGIPFRKADLHPLLHGGVTGDSLRVVSGLYPHSL